MQTLIARAALGAVGAFASIVLTRMPRLRAMPLSGFDRRIVAALVLSRVLFFAALFLVLHLAPRGDIPGFYFPQATAALQGLLPYRDFPSSYAPLHPYLDALFISARSTPLAIILASIAGELLLVPLWLRAGRLIFDENTLRTAALLYLASPISLQFVTVDGQDNVLIALLLAGAMLLALRSRVFVSGILLGLSAAMVKFLPLLYAPAFFAAVPRRWRWAAGTAVVLAAVYGAALLRGLPILQPLTAEGAMRSAGNLPYLLECTTGMTIPARWSDSLLLLVLAGILVLIVKAAQRMRTPARMRILTFGMAALTLALLLLSKKSWPPYLMLCLFPLCLLVAAVSSHPKRAVSYFALFSLVALTEHSVWSSLLLEASSAKLRAALLAGDRTADFFLLLHTGLLGGYVWLLLQAVFAIRTTSLGENVGKTFIRVPRPPA